jgi:hypothetical protein
MDFQAAFKIRKGGKKVAGAGAIILAFSFVSFQFSLQVACQLDGQSSVELAAYHHCTGLNMLDQSDSLA